MFLLLCISKWVLQSDLISKREFKTIGLVQVLWDTTCLVRWLFCVNALLHLLHWKGFSPECVLMWLCRLPDWVKAELHWLHLKGFSPVWLRIMCTFKSRAWMLENPQVVHLWGFSSEWVLLWRFRSLEYVVAWSHWLHLCGFCPVCFIMCTLRWETWLAEKLHWLHLCGFSPVWMREWVFKCSARLNDLLQCEQL